VTQIRDAVNASQKAYSELQAADKAGANITGLAVRFNMALDLLESAKERDKGGDHAGSYRLASEAESSLLALIPEAQSMRDAALSQRQRELYLTMLAVPIEALAVALAVVLVAEVRSRVESRQLRELRIKAGTEGEDTVEEG